MLTPTEPSKFPQNESNNVHPVRVEGFVDPSAYVYIAVVCAVTFCAAENATLESEPVPPGPVPVIASATVLANVKNLVNPLSPVPVVLFNDI